MTKEERWQSLVDNPNPEALWLAVRRLSPKEFFEILPLVATAVAGLAALEAPVNGEVLIALRRETMLAEVMLHRLNFDFMGVERHPEADLSAPVPPRFQRFLSGNAG